MGGHIPKLSRLLYMTALPIIYHSFEHLLAVCLGLYQIIDKYEAVGCTYCLLLENSITTQPDQFPGPPPFWGSNQSNHLPTAYCVLLL